MDTQTFYQKAIVFAASKHQESNQMITDTKLPYVVHLSNVAMEIFVASKYTDNFDTSFAIQLSLLHDTLEDTQTSYEELETVFGAKIAEGVSALTKNKLLPKEERMIDSLRRIESLQTEVWAVKLADRITNLQKPPEHWNLFKKTAYKKEAALIMERLKGGNSYLENRLQKKITEYETYLYT